MPRIYFYSKLLILIGIALSVILILNYEQFGTTYSNLSKADSLKSHFSTWDISHYLSLSQDGYKTGSSSCAFYPLWPGIIHLVSKVTFSNPLVASFLLANIMSFAALWLFFKLVIEHSGATIAQDSLILILAFPGAMFFSFPYTESLFLFFVMLFFYGLDHKRYDWVAAACLLMPLTKAIGIFIVLSLAWHLFERKAAWKYWLLLGVPLVGYMMYFGTMWLYTGNAFEGFAAQASFPNSPSITNMFNIPAIIAAFTNVHSLDGMKDGLLDRMFFILFLCLLPLVYRMNKTWFLYTLASGMVPAMTSGFMSYRRYFIVLFPLFIVMAQLVEKLQSRALFWYYVVILAALQFWAIIKFVTFSWAG